MLELMYRGMNREFGSEYNNIKTNSTNGKFVAGSFAFAHSLLAVLGYVGREQTNCSLV